jgi:hypothetical protein
MFDSTVFCERSQVYPATLAEGYDFLSDVMEDSTRELDEDDMITLALDSIEASATANPIPNTSQVP